MYELFLGAFLLSPFLWIISIYLTQHRKHFGKLVTINCLIFVCYILIINFTNWIDLGHDEYGLKTLVTNISLILLHILLGFISSVLIHRKIKKNIN